MSNAHETDEPINIELNRDEALVLFEFLARTFNDEKKLEIKFDGELQALSALQGRLESILVEPFSPIYLEQVTDARSRLVEQWGSMELQADI